MRWVARLVQAHLHMVLHNLQTTGQSVCLHSCIAEQCFPAHACLQLKLLQRVVDGAINGLAGDDTKVSLRICHSSNAVGTQLLMYSITLILRHPASHHLLRGALIHVCISCLVSA